METEVKMVNGSAMMVLAVALMESAKDGVFRAIVASGLAQVAVHENWNGAEDATRLTVKQVREATADAFGILKGKSQAALWLALSVKVSVKLHKEMRPTLDAARQCEDAESAFALVSAAVREVIGGNGLGQLENWLAGKSKASATKSLGERIIAALAKSEELSDDDLRMIAEVISAEGHRRIAAQQVAQAARDRAEDMAEAA